MGISDESIIINELKTAYNLCDESHNGVVKFLFSYFVSSASHRMLC